MDPLRAQDLLRDLLLRDIGREDVTVAALPGMDRTVTATINSEAEGMVFGLDHVRTLFGLVGVDAVSTLDDGDGVSIGDIILTLTGPAGGVLRAERTALNLLARLSGIATETSRWVLRVREIGGKGRVAATRKTSPGLGDLEKEAVRAGGGDTHRMGLDDCAMVKDNHIVVAGGVTEAVVAVRKHVGFAKKVEVEADELDQAVLAAEAGADIVMLDNFRPEELASAVTILKARWPGLLVEASGGITFDTVAEYALHADVVSSGALTMDAPSHPFRLDM